MNHDDQDKSTFGAGLVLGAIIGAVAGIFLAPKSGKEMREDAASSLKDIHHKINSGEIQARVQEIFGEVTDEGMKLYKETKKELTDKLESAKDHLSKSEYLEMLEEVIDSARERTQASVEYGKKIRDSFMEGYKGEEVKSSKAKSKK